MPVLNKNKYLKKCRCLKLNRVLLMLAALIFLLLFMFTAFTACTQKSGYLNFTEKDNGSSVSLSKGEKLEIKLESNITTGYSWKLSENTGTSVMAIVSSEYKEPGKDKEMVGTGGIETFIFEARGAGQTEIILEYERPWEENTEPEKVFKLKITVQQSAGSLPDQ